MKLRDHRLPHRAQGPITNQEVIRAIAVIAELKLNIKKAHELRHTARNLMTIHRLMLEEIHRRRCRNLTKPLTVI
jgi:hypothetical protein